MAWRLKLSSTFVYGASSTCVHATAKMRTSSTKDIGAVDHFDHFGWRMDTAGPTGPVPFQATTSDRLALHSLPHLPDLWCPTPSPQHVFQAMGDILSPLAHLNRRCEGKE
jgi:hypothetical protein